MTEGVPLAISALKKLVKESMVHGPFGQFLPPSPLLKYYADRRTVDKLLTTLDLELSLRTAVQGSWAIVFTILVLIGKTEHFRHFTSRDLSDKCLPFRSPADWNEECSRCCFGSFYEQQWSLLPWVLKHQGIIDLHLPEETILPVVNMEPLGHSGHSSTFKITVHPDCDQLFDKRQTHPHIYVLKTCHRGEEGSYRNEVNAYELLTNHEDRKGKNEIGQNLLNLYGHFRYKGEYHLILEYADLGNLDNYWEKIGPPLRVEDRIRFFQGLAQLVKVLQRMHELYDSPGKGYKLQGVHQDIKPANILVSRRSLESDYDVDFKLIDFGLLRFIKRPLAGESVTCSDMCGTQMYSAPESLRDDTFLQGSKIPVGTGIDIWSLGCVFSEAIIWCALGKEGLTKYTRLRTEETDIHPTLRNTGYSGCFHNGETALRAVFDMHIEALDSPRGGYGGCQEMIAITEDMMVEANSRATAVVLYRKCNIGLRIAEARKGISHPHDPVMRTDPEQASNDTSLPKFPTRPTNAPSRNTYPLPNPTKSSSKEMHSPSKPTVSPSRPPVSSPPSLMEYLPRPPNTPSRFASPLPMPQNSPSSGRTENPPLRSPYSPPGLTRSNSSSRPYVLTPPIPAYQPPGRMEYPPMPLISVSGSGDSPPTGPPRGSHPPPRRSEPSPRPRRLKKRKERSCLTAICCCIFAVLTLGCLN
ncbi:kinase-like domain-containing protein [Clohesyomyces aquaticus]|uniref:Kinase-like domain-containing protein n=1 Tax=Clohesyomyces aquaticus TaxID=1231657 RepID=A0A1Y1YNG0_9PLEO|nr:kinase-like domain-containing protein [Clohesyomyces aquaticus]